ncbi:MAG: glycosyltransferase [Clostridium sp.]|nr:glycosyltransferase [Clostridium sp.]
MKKKVCHISTAHMENDSRILYKECYSLKRAGYNVSFIVTSNKEKNINGVDIIPLSQCTSRRERIIKKRKEAYQKALEIDADIYHFHDPELINIGRKLKKKGKKVIYDVHEDMPKQILTKTYLGSMWIRKIVSKIFNFYEKSNSKHFDAIITPQEKIKEAFESVSDNITIIKNYAIKDSSKDSFNQLGITEREIDEDKLILIYVGSITKIRGIREIINATVPFNGRVELWLLGIWENEEIKHECERLEGYKFTKYLGVVSPDEVCKYIKKADIGLSVLYPTINYKEAIPTKVFEYMACGKPVILSDFEYWRFLFGNVGSYVNPKDNDDIVKAIDLYLKDRDAMKNQGAINAKVFDEKFSWDLQEKKLLNLYSKL